MNITSPILTGAFSAAELPGDFVTSLLKMVGAGTGLFDDSVDGGLGMVMSAPRGHRRGTGGGDAAVDLFSERLPQPARHCETWSSRHARPRATRLRRLDMRHAALAYLGLYPAKPAVEFEIRLPKAALMVSGYPVELLTDRNQKLAQVQDALASTLRRPQRAEGHRDARLPHHRTYRGADLPGQAQASVQAATAGEPIAFRIGFGSWHLTDAYRFPVEPARSRH